MLSRTWRDISSLIQPIEALDVFLTHLNQRPVAYGSGVTSSLQYALAIHSLLGLTKVGDLILSNMAVATKLADAWPGILAWSNYLYQDRFMSLDKDDPGRASTLDFIASYWYHLSWNDLSREAMLSTPLTLEIIAQLWLEQDSVATQQSMPVVTSVLCRLLYRRTLDDMESFLALFSS